MVDNNDTTKGVLGGDFDLSRKILAHDAFSKKLGGSLADRFVDLRSDRMSRSTSRQLGQYAMGSRELAVEVGLRYLPLAVEGEFLPWLFSVGLGDLYPSGWQARWDRDLLRLFEDEQEDLVWAAIRGQRTPTLRPIQARSKLSEAESRARRISRLVRRIESTSKGLGRLAHETASAQMLRFLPQELAEVVRMSAGQAPRQAEVALGTLGERAVVEQPTRIGAQKARALALDSPYPAGVGRISAFTEMLSARATGAVPGENVRPSSLAGPAAFGLGGEFIRGVQGEGEQAERISPERHPVSIDDVTVQKGALPALSSSLQALTRLSMKAEEGERRLLGSSDSRGSLLDRIDLRAGGDLLASSREARAVSVRDLYPTERGLHHAYQDLPSIQLPQPVIDAAKPEAAVSDFSAAGRRVANEALARTIEQALRQRLALPKEVSVKKPSLERAIAQRVQQEVQKAAVTRRPAVLPPTAIDAALVGAKFDDPSVLKRRDVETVLAKSIEQAIRHRMAQTGVKAGLPGVEGMISRRVQEELRLVSTGTRTTAQKALSRSELRLEHSIMALAGRGKMNTSTGEVASEGGRKEARSWRLFSPAKALSLSMLSAEGPAAPTYVDELLSARATRRPTDQLALALTEGRHALRDWQQSTSPERFKMVASTPYGRVVIERTLDGARAMRVPLLPTDSLVQVMSEEAPAARSGEAQTAQPTWEKSSAVAARAMSRTQTVMADFNRSPIAERPTGSTTMATVSRPAAGVPRAVRSAAELLVSMPRGAKEKPTEESLSVGLELARILGSSTSVVALQRISEAGARSPGVIRELAGLAPVLGRRLSAIGLIESEDAGRIGESRPMSQPWAERLLVMSLPEGGREATAERQSPGPRVNVIDGAFAGLEPWGVGQQKSIIGESLFLESLAAKESDIAQAQRRLFEGQGPIHALARGLQPSSELVGLSDEVAGSIPLRTQVAREVLLPASVRSQSASGAEEARILRSRLPESSALSVERLTSQPKSAVLGAAAAGLSRVLNLTGDSVGRVTGSRSLVSLERRRARRDEAGLVSDGPAAEAVIGEQRTSMIQRRMGWSPSASDPELARDLRERLPERAFGSTRELRIGGWSAPFGPLELQQLVSLVDENTGRSAQGVVRVESPRNLEGRLERSQEKAASMSTWGRAAAKTELSAQRSVVQTVTPKLVGSLLGAEGLRPRPEVIQAKLDLSNPRLASFAGMEQLHIEAQGRAKSSSDLAARKQLLQFGEAPTLRRWSSPFQSLLLGRAGQFADQPAAQMTSLGGPWGMERTFVQMAEDAGMATPEVKGLVSRPAAARAEAAGQPVARGLRELGAAPLPTALLGSMPESAVGGGAWATAVRSLHFADLPGSIRFAEAMSGGPVVRERQRQYAVEGMYKGELARVAATGEEISAEVSQRVLRARGVTPEALRRLTAPAVKRQIATRVEERPERLASETVRGVLRRLEGRARTLFVSGGFSGPWMPVGLDFAGMIEREVPEGPRVSGAVAGETLEAHPRLSLRGRQREAVLGPLMADLVQAGRAEVDIRPVGAISGRLGAVSRVQGPSSDGFTSKRPVGRSGGRYPAADFSWLGGLRDVLAEQERGRRAGKSPDLGWLRRELDEIVSVGGRMGLDKHLGQVVQPRGAASTWRLLDYLEGQRDVVEVQAKQRQMDGSSIFGRPGPVVEQTSQAGRVSRGRRSLGRDSLQQVSMIQGDRVQGDKTAPDRQVVSPWAGQSAPEAGVRPYAAKGAAGGKVSSISEPDTSEASAKMSPHELMTLAEDVYSYIKQRLHMEDMRTGGY